MIDTGAVAAKPTLVGRRIRLVPLARKHADALFEDLHDPETLRLTGTHRSFTREEIEQWCATRAEQTDRLDLAVETLDAGAYAGELSLNGIDVDNESAGYRIALNSKHLGQGYGTEATGLILEYAFGVIGLHRVQLEVFDFNERARRCYEKSGFVLEGRLRDALTWDGRRHDTLVMGALNPRH